MIGRLVTTPALDRPDLLAEPVAAAIRALGLADVLVAEIDPSDADTAAFCERYAVGLDVSANCVVVAGRRGGDTTLAACMVLATDRADVNGVVRRRIDARKASFASIEVAVAETGMEYGGITPIGLPAEWRLLVDESITRIDLAIIGSGIRGSKLFVPGLLLGSLPGAEVVPDLAR
jgi:prolyl-tRNA editing enzyme YbaK/EbsC (Cys-tRNA(Pro) deacylase)